MKRLLIDLDRFAEHDKCAEKCSYYYHPGNYGILSLQEVATYSIACRKCEKENCVTSCPFNALEKGADKILRRYNLRCTSCKTCSHACHSGVILPEFIPYMAYNCDLCLDRLKGDDLPDCVPACTCGAVKYGDFTEDAEKNLYAIGKNLVVHSIHWQREIPKKARK